MEKDGRLPPQSNGGSVVQASKNLSNPEPNLRIFIAGATGVVGRRVVPLLVAAGHRVTAVARTPEKGAELERMGAAAVYVDLFASDSVRGAVAGHDIVINLATSIPPSSRVFLPGAWRKSDRVRSRHARSAPAEVPPGWVPTLTGSLGEMIARSLPISNRKLRQARGWSPRYPSAREGWRSIIEATDRR